ncbi:MAG: DUF748 domain-containing protein [Desulfotalea sp.]
MSDDFGSINIEAPDEGSNIPKKRGSRRKRAKEQVAPSETPLTVEPAQATKAEENPIPTPVPPKQSKKDKPKKRKRSKTLPIFFFAILPLLLIASYFAIGFIAIPLYLNQQIQNIANNDISLSKPKISFNPISFELHIKNLQINSHQTNNERDLIDLPSLKFHISPRAILNGQIISTKTEINNPTVSIYKRNDGSINLSEKFSNFKLSKILDEITFYFALEKISINDGHFIYEDIPGATSHLAEKVFLSTPVLSNIPGKDTDSGNTSFSAIINGSPISFTPDSESNDKISLNLENIGLAKYFQYLPNILPFNIINGTGNGNIVISLTSKGDGPSLNLKLEADSILMNHQDNDTSLEISKAIFDATILPFSKQVIVNKIVLQNPFLKTTSKINEMADVFASASQKAQLTVNELRIKNGTITNVSGKTKKLESIEAKISQYTNIGKGSGSFDITAKNGISMVSWQGQMQENVFSGPLKISNLPITDFAKWTNIDFNKQDSGDLNLSATLSHIKNGAKYNNTISKAKVLIKNAKLYHAGKQWLAAKEISISGASFKDEKNNLGSVKIKSGNANFSQYSPPKFLSDFGNEKNTILKSLDFDGVATIRDKKGIFFSASALSIQAKDLDLAQLSTDNISIKAKIKSGGTLSSKGRCKIKPFSALLNSKFTLVPAASIAKAVNGTNFFSNLTGKISGSGTINLPAFSYKGSLSIGPNKLPKNLGPLKSWKSAYFHNYSYQSKSKQFTVSSITLKQPIFTWQRGNVTNSPNTSPGKMLRKMIGANKKGQSLRINRVKIKQGIINIEDKRLKPQWNGKISNVNGSVEAINSKSSNKPTVFNLTGKFVDAKIKAQGSMKVFSSSPRHNLSLIINDLPVTAFSSQLPQLKKMGAIPKFVDLDLIQEQDNSGIKTAVNLKIKGIKPKWESTAVALAILQGKGKYPTLTIANQSSTGKNVPLVKIINNYAQQLQMKTDISPFLLADQKFFDLKGKEKVEFLFGQTVLAGASTEILIRLREFLTNYPKLDVQVQGFASKKVDRIAMQEQLYEFEEQRVAVINNKRLAQWKKEQLESQNDIPDEEGFKEENIFIPLQPEPSYVTDEMLIELANQRAKTVATILSGQLALASDRIRIAKTTSLVGDSSNSATVKLASKNFTGGN